MKQEAVRNAFELWFVPVLKKIHRKFIKSIFCAITVLQSATLVPLSVTLLYY